jgi:tetratricopeptide (TPR) repeat protein
VTARALIGSGVLAGMRGNYPEARTLFRRAVTIAETCGAHEHWRAGHHGLFVAALAARDLETALTHGWAAFQSTSPDAGAERAEMLINLGELSCEAGEYRSALGACLNALELTDEPRLRLAAATTAARSCARLGEIRLLDVVNREVKRAVSRSGQPFENARACVEMGEVYVGVDAAIAADFAERAAALTTGRFHELNERLERLRAILDGSTQREFLPSVERRDWSSQAQEVLTSLEQRSPSFGRGSVGVC